MADALLSIPLQIALEKLAQVLREQIGLYAGATRELKKIRKTFQSIKGIIGDAENQQIAKQSVRDWLSDLKAIAHDMEDVLDEWQISGLQNDGSDDDVDEDKVRTCFPSPCACFNHSASRYKIARQIEEIRDKLDEIVEDQKRFNFTINSGEAAPVSRRPQTGALVEESEIIGRDQDKETVISSLVSGSSSGDGDGWQVHVTAIVGIGGLGKTTLAQQIHQDGRVQDHFNKALYWVCVSEVFDVIRLIKAIIQEVNKVPSILSELNSLQNELLESFRGKRFLLVLDDVWNDEAEKWEPLRLSLKSGAQGSRILVTTRSERVANMMNAAYIHQLKGLSDDLSWKLFSSRAFAGRAGAAEKYSEVESVGRKIVSKCRGVPLSIKVMGSAMNTKRAREDWQNILDSTMWSLPQVTDKILPALMLSYYNLPPYLKQCFAYCSIYQKDTVMYKDELVKLWLAQGFIQPQGNREMEDIGDEYFNDLVACSMFQEVGEGYRGKTTCKMHDLLHDLAEFITKDERYIFTSENSHNQCSVNVRHASLFFSEDNTRIPPASFQAIMKLRTLFVHSLNESGTILNDLFHQARFLRALLLRSYQITTLPESIGKLKHLKYLDLSGSNIVEFPNVFEKMRQLSYLNLSHSKIVELPESVSHLVHLHTLNLNWCGQLKKLPRGIGGMVGLRHLEIEETPSLESMPEGLGKISCLQSLWKFIVGGEGGCGIGELQGLNSLQESLKIEHLERVSSSEEAEKAELWNKRDLRNLDFSMSSERDEEIVMSRRTDAKKERMQNVLNGLRPHVNVESLYLSCDCSSSMVKLPSWMEDSSFSKLTTLDIKGFRQCEENLPGLGKLPALKFLYIRGVGVRKLGYEFYYGMSSSDAGGVAFPKLEQLYLIGMHKLEEWELAWEADNAQKVMPSLRVLEISYCRELRVLPPHLAYAPLTELAIEGVKAFCCVPDLLRQLGSLEYLCIGFSQKRQPDSLGQPESLEGPAIVDCQKLVLMSLGQLKKLQSFTIEGAALTCLPDSLGQLESLEKLFIVGCRELVSLPDSFGQLKALKILSIGDCEALELLPQDLSLLQEIYIRGCPLLRERCKREGGEDWPKISHIPRIFIDDD